MWSWFLARLKGIFNFFASLILFVVLLVIVSSVIGAFTQEKLPGEVVLTMDLRNGLPDKSAPNPFAADQHRVGSLIDAVTALAKAESDDRVKGAFIRVGGAGMSLASAQELRAAIKAFRAKGKFVVAHAQAFYSTGMGDYYLASAADELWLQPVSEMNTAGVSSTAVFLRSLLDKIEAKPEFTQRYEYKNAMNMFTEKDFTPAHREANLRLIESIFETATSGIAADRKKKPEEVVALINGAPYLTQEAIDKKLIDKQGYDDEAEDAALAKAGGKAELMKLTDYYKQAGSPWEGMGRPTIAFVHGDGQINDGESEDGGFGGEGSMGGDTIAQAIRDATEDDDVKAILFRVNSPGGSALASDQILDAIKKAQKAGKKVVVSMGNVAASGGYYVSLSADKIFAHESTITGSIGVLSGKIVTVGSWALLGIDLKPLGIGTNALMDSAVTPFTPEQWAAFNKGVDQIYNDFTAKVAAGRKLPLEKVREIAKGRVWSGTDAKARGLVDEFGGFRAALEATKALAGLPADAEINLKSYPAPRSPFEEIAEMFGTSAEMVRTISLMGKVMETEPVADMMKLMIDESNANRAPQMKMPEQKTK
ncbi:MAG: signal peptide peptidase SppA [Alphaproteobacteria bacterium]|nr:signal peptide peptidase SppA [Alphaproteobacteria bacterium]